MLFRWMPNCVKCVTLVVELRTDAQAVQKLVGVVEVVCVDHGRREPGGGPDGVGDVEVERERAHRGELDRAAALADARLAYLAVEAAERLRARLGRDRLHGLLEARGDGGRE